MSEETLQDADYPSLAKRLEEHPDYRVLRRLPIRDAYALPDGKVLKKGLVLDTECTGLSHDKDEVIELAMVVFEYDPDTGKVYRIVEAFGALEEPSFLIPPESTAIHGITDEMVSGHKIDDAEVARIVSDVAIIIAHNAGYDRPMVEKRFPFFCDLPWLCSLKEIDWAGEGFASGKLEFLAQQSGFFYDAHRAEMDCRAVLELLQKTAKDGDPFLKRLLMRMDATDIRFWALNAPFDQKDLLKERGYRWHAENPKAWHITVSKETAREESNWLYERVYNSKPATIRIDVLNSLTRYTDRVAKTQSYQIKPESS
ncbi:3'-5' exonuclease [Sulfurirhabdus autotrophica]|uniref:DNA polymerase-3 subunit epsilon n=1 Tax=Sulfurirhabdus autotrophica TaxID=1706046 RepID=A0A4R3XSU1_9PROT|nr:3'-5' exonuclease [Sulfurirhabdus autotrophica]TCV82725.1 DNA polymerase-3 subunit epsilon [Sulfurirhabdus autotrophica]